MQQVVDRWQKQYPERIDPAILAHIAPIHDSHINLRGIFQFLFGPYGTDQNIGIYLYKCKTPPPRADRLRETCNF